MSIFSYRPINRGIAALMLAGALLVPASSRADQIDDILKISETQFPLRSGMARGRVLGREGDKLKMQLRDVPFDVAVDQVSTTPAQFLAEARRLIGESKHRRAAVQYGMARLLDPQSADPAFEQEILKGIETQITKVKDFRSEREKAQQDAFEKKALEDLASSYPLLYALLQANPDLLPKFPPAPGTTLDEWQTAVTRNHDVWQKFRAARESTEDPDTRLRAMQAVIRSLPPMEKAREEMKKDSGRLDSIVSMFVYADAHLWIDRLQYEQAKQEYELAKASQQDPLAKYRALAREGLLEKLVPSKRVEKVRRGNLWEERVIPLPRNAAVVESLQPRINAEFIEERRTDSGFYFVTSEGDGVFVPVSNWAEIDNAQKLTSPEERFLQADRIGLQNFRKGIRALTIALADSPNDADRIMALKILLLEAMNTYGTQEQVQALTSKLATTTSVPTTQP